MKQAGWIWVLSHHKNNTEEKYTEHTHTLVHVENGKYIELDVIQERRTMMVAIAKAIAVAAVLSSSWRQRAGFQPPSKVVWVFVKPGRDQKTKDNERLDYVHLVCMSQCVQYIYWCVTVLFFYYYTAYLLRTLLPSNGVTSVLPSPWNVILVIRKEK